MIRSMTCLTIAAVTLSPLPPSTYALLTSSVEVTGNHFSSAFVFPQTVNDLAVASELFRADAEARIGQATELYDQLLRAESLEAGENIWTELSELLMKVIESVASTRADLLLLSEYHNQAQGELSSAKSDYEELVNQIGEEADLYETSALTSLETKMHSAERVAAYVMSAYERGEISTGSINESVNHAEHLMIQAEQQLEELRANEEKQAVTKVDGEQEVEEKHKDVASGQVPDADANNDEQAAQPQGESPEQPSDENPAQHPEEKPVQPSGETQVPPTGELPVQQPDEKPPEAAGQPTQELTESMESMKGAE
ncbi:hypothetical protein SY83_12055 [Paenibacillus swuensis]|uniref:DUF5667 domain-containing protein n=1 Tax=Paenibacillus swuensis TaxID=1178515 RepID=A0A172TIJ9_9BACL|nr:hypothetical protein [Paenibacillus swuensis]ANE46889.1 hypothetical protein SY83_12055 [Paenibacillus swuensis]